MSDENNNLCACGGFFFKKIIAIGCRNTDRNRFGILNALWTVEQSEILNLFFQNQIRNSIRNI